MRRRRCCRALIVVWAPTQWEQEKMSPRQLSPRAMGLILTWILLQQMQQLLLLLLSAHPVCSAGLRTLPRSLTQSRIQALAPTQQGRNSGSQLTMPVGGGTLFSWGLREARLGRKDGDNSIPEPALTPLNVISIAASRHSAVSSAEGHVWTMGHNDSRGGGGHGSKPLAASGQLGRGGSTQAARVLDPVLKDLFVVQVVTGRYHTLAVTDTGHVYSWGLNDWGQLGRAAVGALGEGDLTPCFSGAGCHDGQPHRVQQLEGVHVVGASAGRYNSIALDTEGRLHVWGCDGCASGVLPERDAAFQPRLVQGELQGKRVTAVDSGYTLWIAATQDGEVYTCNHQDDGYGRTLKNKRQGNDAGELGRGGDPHVPMQVKGALEGQRVRAVAAGREHALACTAEGRVYSWGGGQDVAGRTGDRSTPGLVLGELEGDQCVLVAAGEYFSLAASRRHVYGWGGNNYHSLGVGRSIPKATSPRRALGPLAEGNWTILALAAGFQHAMAIAARGDAVS